MLSFSTALCTTYLYTSPKMRAYINPTVTRLPETTFGIIMVSNSFQLLGSVCDSYEQKWKVYSTVHLSNHTGMVHALPLMGTPVYPGVSEADGKVDKEIGAVL